jgi:hypothetical protein
MGNQVDEFPFAIEGGEHVIKAEAFEEPGGLAGWRFEQGSTLADVGAGAMFSTVRSG